MKCGICTEWEREELKKKNTVFACREKQTQRGKERESEKVTSDGTRTNIVSSTS
jgi:hypothetical protein